MTGSEKYGELLSRMIAFCAMAHAGQVDKGGAPYILHPLEVMRNLRTQDEELMCIAVGHDVIEDGKIGDESVTQSMLAELGMSARVLNGIACLTRNPGESELDYRGRVKSNRDACLVKRADLEHNMDLLRVTKVTGSMMRRMEKYHTFWVELTAMGYS